MPRKKELSWFKARQCWCKKYRGVRHYLKAGKGLGKTNEVGYAAALNEWEALKAEIDQDAPNKPHEADYRAAIEDRRTIEKWFRQHPETMEFGVPLATAVAERRALEAELRKPEPL